MVTGAERLPHMGSLLEIGMGDSSSAQLGPEEELSAVIIPPAFMRWASMPHMRPAPARKQRMNPTTATPTFIPPPSYPSPTGRSAASLDCLSFAMIFTLDSI